MIFNAQQKEDRKNPLSNPFLCLSGSFITAAYVAKIIKKKASTKSGEGKFNASGE